MRSPDLQGRTPSLADTIRTLIDAELVNVHTAMPGEVVTYYPETQTADIQPSLKRKYYDGSLSNLPVLIGVPIEFPYAQNFHMHWPLKKGDPVIIRFSERSLDNWKTAGGIVDPADPRKFNLSDATATPGGNSPAKAFEPTEPDAFELVFEDSKLIIYPEGKIAVRNSTDEIVDILSSITEKLQSLCETLGSDTTNTILGPMPLNAFVTYTNLSTEVSALKTKLDGFKE